ncbi:MAG: hypothetical protein GC187_08395 [Alphaproteobacteria bacterium]|nr:hypothetical protein [Alphaproteobacteria bacterium]
MSSKYDPLRTHLEAQTGSEIPMKFKDIEALIGQPLPPSAFRHRPWWSNNPSNSVITYAWLRAGFETCQVDMGSQKLVFRRVRRAAPSGPAGALPPERHTDRAPRPTSLLGALRGMVRFASTGAAIEPSGASWNADKGRM